MKQASGLKRFLAWIIDISIFFPIYFLTAKIIETIYKTYFHYPKIKNTGMFAYNPGDFQVFFMTVFFLLICAVLIHFISLKKFHKTLGHALLKILRLNQDGSQLTPKQINKLTLTTILKISMICLPGPFLAMFTNFILRPMGFSKFGDLPFYLSLILLFLALFFLIISPIIAYFKTDKLSWVEKYTNTFIYEVTDEDQ